MAYWWIVPEIALYGLLSWASVKNAAGVPDSALFVWIIGALPMWAIVSKNSTNLLFDGMLYDSIMLLTYAISISYYQNTLNNNCVNVLLGVMMIVGGILVLRMPPLW